MSAAFLSQLRDYNNWANDTWLSAFEQNNDKIPAFSLRVLSHIFNTQVVWTERIMNIPQTLAPWDEHSFEVCQELNASSSLQIDAVLDQYADNLPAIISYKNSQGKSFQNSVSDILIHMFNHATYHRGQIASDFRRNGLEPVTTDYIFYKRS